jgi:hypothetical protein
VQLFVLGNRHGGIFNQFGVGAAGAMKHFFESNLKSSPLSPHFAAKPYREYDAAAYIVHFQVCPPGSVSALTQIVSSGQARRSHILQMVLSPTA